MLENFIGNVCEQIFTIKDSLAVGIAFIIMQNSTNKPVTINVTTGMGFL